MKEIFTFIRRHVQISGMLLYVFLNKITDNLQLLCPLSACNDVKGKIFLSKMVITVLSIVLIYSDRGFVLIYYIVGINSNLMKCKTNVNSIILGWTVRVHKPLNTECYYMKFNSIRYKKRIVIKSVSSPSDNYFSLKQLFIVAENC